ncbi:MAG: 23S rRNA (guanosine(2251)-2'-O)-methyltransferase RlmB [Flavobacteriales bacterium]|jgi:23S rRNA (guanosine2251-2'-O)-methyltransferase|nr:23S rRNA (guanosine(2251)-2'-O)-methyltransferase RlmB [Flavobacteriales bacterium]|tara:strand:- start:3764 stop:4501 length:738 start_codon:yes stop_codon:yes gene_type:complete
MDKKLYVYGIRPVLELLESKKEIDTIYLQKDLKTEWSIIVRETSKKRNINLKLVPKHKLNRLTKKYHQGVIGLASHIQFQNFENLLSSIFDQGKFPLFLLLDRITDVRNFGSICRSAEAMGVDGILIPKKESAQINEIAIKASAGAIANIHICRVDNLVQSVKIAKDNGLTVLSCSEKGSKLINKINLNKPILIIIGSERNGISQNLINISDEIGKIATTGKTASLNAAVASAIILFEYNRQKHN